MLSNHSIVLLHPFRMKQVNHILFCVLNWGLGHATRSSPIIQFFSDHGVKIDIASDGLALQLLKKQFPHANFITLPGYNVKYAPKEKLLPITLLSQIPSINKTIQKEYQCVQNVLEKGSYDLIISDHRIGCYTHTIPSVLITHQLQLKVPKIFSWINRRYSKYLKNFDQYWVPDHFDQKLRITNDLSAKPTPKSHFIGWQSTYKKQNLNKDISHLILLSGPEPQRSILEKKLHSIFKNRTNWVMVRGTNLPPSIPLKNEYYDIAYHSKMQELLNRAKIVVSRSGYSSIMDYKILDIPAILIPTPGQTEQVYLAQQLNQDNQFMIIDQNDITANILEWTPDINNIAKKSLSKKDEAFYNALNQLSLTIPT